MEEDDDDDDNDDDYDDDVCIKLPDDGSLVIRNMLEQF